MRNEAVAEEERLHQQFGYSWHTAVVRIDALDTEGTYIPGTSDRDILHGGPLADFISGYAGDDRLTGESGEDRLNGGEGNDHLFGGDGADFIIAGMAAIGSTVEMATITSAAAKVQTGFMAATATMS